MLFSSTTFLFLFLSVTLLGYYVMFRGMRRAQNLFLLVVSLLFYAWGEPWFVAVMLVSIAVNYLLGLWAHHARRKGRSTKPVVTVAAVLNLSLLFAFKYLGRSFVDKHFAGYRRAFYHATALGQVAL